MKTKRKNINRICIGMPIVLLCLCLDFGCASYFQIAEPPDNMGLIYIYRPKKFFQGGLKFAVHANGFKINTLYNGGYFTYLAKPGRIQFSVRTEITSYVTLDVKAGQAYYIKGSVRPGNLIPRPHLQLVSSEAGKNEIVISKQMGQGRDADVQLALKPDKSKEE